MSDTTLGAPIFLVPASNPARWGKRYRLGSLMTDSLPRRPEIGFFLSERRSGRGRGADRFGLRQRFAIVSPCVAGSASLLT